MSFLLFSSRLSARRQVLDDETWSVICGSLYLAALGGLSDEHNGFLKIYANGEKIKKNLSEAATSAEMQKIQPESGMTASPAEPGALLAKTLRILKP